MRIDSHHHFGRYDPAQYPWIRPEWPIRRDYLPSDLEPLLSAGGFDGSIAVQARSSLEESRWLLELAERHAVVMGVVGWVDLRSPELEEQLTPLATHPRFVGVRHVVQDEPDDRFLVRQDFLRGMRVLEPFRLVYDLLVFPRQLPAAIELAQQCAHQVFVLDHLAKPPIREGIVCPWREHVHELARSPNVSCKVSGLVTESRWQDWERDDFRPYLDVVFEAFGPDRVLFGSDWPVCLLAASYPQVCDLVEAYTRPFKAEDRAKFFGGNAARIYRLDHARPPASW
jgi:L-fuconolactonase